MLSERESTIHGYGFRNEADSFSSLLQLKVIYLHQFRISVDFFLLGPAENSCQEWTTVAKEDTFINFHLNTGQK